MKLPPLLLIFVKPNLSAFWVFNELSIKFIKYSGVGIYHDMYT